MSETERLFVSPQVVEALSSWHWLYFERARCNKVIISLVGSIDNLTTPITCVYSNCKLEEYHEGDCEPLEPGVQTIS